MSDVLVLNADAQPLNYLPLSAVSWRDAIQQIWLDKCTVLEYYDDWVVSSPSTQFQVPAIIMMKDFFRRHTTPRFSKLNCHIRDLYSCQYCNTQQSHKELTLDHVLPRSHGGRTSWLNIVTACKACNVAKGNRLTPLPMIKPYRPSYYELVEKRKQFDFSIRHDSWRQFI
jgi:5-methylcytosine-specific restriction endonuclease McrA